ncbi:MAG: methyl-accepting chemotaxis protein, partial [Spirochaetes bacterium]|nr:methyl-accepting chemotaxis protein [Spirochaetota bacterium]
MAVLAFVIAQRAFSNAGALSEAYSHEVVSARADQLSAMISRYTRFAQDVAIRDIIIRGDKKEVTALMPRLDPQIEDEFDGMFVAWPNGDFVTMKGQTGSVSSREYFKDIMSGKADSVVANPVISLATGKPIVVIGAAIKRNGRNDGMVGIQITLDALSKTAAAVKLGKTGAGFIVDGTGLVIAHPNPDFVMKLDTLKSGELGYKGLDVAGRAMMRGDELDSVITRPDGSRLQLFSSVVDGTPLWSLGVMVPLAEIQESGRSIATLVIAFSLAAVAIIIALSVLIGRSIAKPVQAVADAADELARGHLDVDLPQAALARSDEIGVLSRSMGSTIARLREVVLEVKEASDSVSAGSDELTVSAQQMATGIAGIADSSQQLSQGATEQAASAEEVSASVEQMGANIKQNADNSFQT